MKPFFYIFLLFIVSNQLSAQCYSLVWQEEFNGTSLDTSRWNRWIGPAFNNELQYYRARPENIVVSNGTLKLRGRQEAYAGYNYTSGRIDTRYKVDHLYGKIEGRMKIPAGQGLWPAFWMLPTNGAWPVGGEIDIMEILGNTTNKTYGTCHYAVNGNLTSSGTSYTLPTGNFAQGFHTFTVEWTATTIKWKVDNVLFHSVTKAQIGAANWPFNKPFYVVLNLAVGGNWPGSPNASTVFPADFEVDWVKIYQTNANIAIKGNTFCSPQLPTTFKLPSIAGATYAWSIPAGGSIVSGQGTSNIVTNWTNIGTYVVNCVLTTACGTQTKTMNVVVTANQLTNPSFEANKVDWNHIQNAGSSIFTTPQSASAPDAAKVCKMVVSALGTNSWDIQLTKPLLPVLKDSSYTFRFWAKANANGKQTQVNFLHPTNYTNYAWQNISLSTNWTQYTLTFVAPYTGNLLFTEDFNFQTGTFFTDHYFFGRTSVANLAQTQPETNAFLLSDDADMQVFPNPVVDVLHVKNRSNVVFTLFDTQGRILLSGTCGDEATHQISMRDFPAGTYLLELQLEDGALQTERIVKL